MAYDNMVKSKMAKTKAFVQKDSFTEKELEETMDKVFAETGGLPDALVVGVGTGGTLTGVGRRIRKARPDLHIATVIPEIFPGIDRHAALSGTVRRPVVPRISQGRGARH